MGDWLTWSNALYLAGMVLAGLLTVYSAKYRKVIKEVKDVVDKLGNALEDKKLSKKEKEVIMKEVLDVLSAMLKVFWKK
tara:strand:+ start:1369 stop:1605 length:237 start_codon:yes stop_codon:yes gene_type:complete